MMLAKKLVLWLLIAVGVSIATVAWRPIIGESTLVEAAEHGELVSVSLTLTATALGYAGVASVGGGLDVLRIVILGFGLIVLVLCALTYGHYSDLDVKVDDGETRLAISAAFFASSCIIGAASTYIAHIGGY